MYENKTIRDMLDAIVVQGIKDYAREKNKPMNKTLRDPKTEELDTPEFNAVWNLIKDWDIGLPQDYDDKTGHQLYSGATSNHVVAILDVIREVLINEL